MLAKSKATSIPNRYSHSLIRAQDFAWILFVGALLVGTPERNYNADILLPLIGAFQIIEPRLKMFASKRGQALSLILKLLLSYLLVGYTHPLDSPYYAIFLIPLVSAATTYRFPTVLLVTAIAGLAYLSFLLPVFTNGVPLAEEFYSLLILRVSFFAIIAFVVYEQAQAKRSEMARTKEAADRLAESNENLRATQVSLRRSERLAALGQLTAGLAHELRNPLGTIKASAEMLTRKGVLENPQLAREMASYIESEVNRMNALITSFLNFARPLQIHPVESDFNELLKDIFRRESRLASTRSVQLLANISPEAVRFIFDPGVLSIALSNLIQNAIEASSPGSTVSINTDRFGDEIHIYVIDKGEGISPQNLENIFNPFFTTKSDGIGLGLAIVSKIVDEHGGIVLPSSTLGKGTTFEIILPAKPANETVASAGTT